MSITDPLIGRKLGDYTVEGLLGTGGMARVYKGYDDKLDRYAAVKIIEPNMIGSSEEEEYRDRFIREARAIARLSHTRIVGVYQFGQIDNLYYIAMDYVAGKNLREVLKDFAEKGQYMPIKDILNILGDIAGALDYAHKNGIIHRDIKPSNIIVNPEGHAILTDFGLVLNATEGTIGNTFGSVHYIAPEQAISSAQAVPQSDQYSLGIVAYEMLTGQVPFDDASAMSVALKHISDLPPPPTEINPDIPAEVEQILMKALDKDHQKRYEQAQHFVQALRTAYAMIDAPGIVAESVTESTTQLYRMPPTPRPDAASDAPTLNDSSVSQKLSAGRQGSQTKSPAPLPSAIPGRVPDNAVGRQYPIPPLLMGAAAVLVLIVAAAFLLPSLLGESGMDATATASTLEANTVQLEVSGTALVVAQLATEESATEESLQMATEVTATELATSESSTPRATQTTAPTATREPTATSEATATREATATTEETATTEATVTSEPSPTLRPSNTPAPTQTLTPGFVLSETDAAELLLRYDGRSLVLYNRSEESSDVAALRFILFEPQIPEPEDEEDAESSEEGTPTFVETNSFLASEWGNLRNGLDVEHCLQVWTLDFVTLSADEAPADMCNVRRFFRATARPFWISEATDTAYFEVRRGPVDVLARCPVNLPGTFTEQRCVVSLNGN